ncbi:MAG: serine/threonine protein kinase [Spirulina sp.]
MSSPIFPIANCDRDPRGQILVYPHGTLEDVRARLPEFADLSIENIYNFGQTVLPQTRKKSLPIRVIGIGYTGIVVLARVKNQDVALKIRRMDSSQPDLLQEAKFLAMANGVGVGPQLLGNTRNLLVMEYIQGDRFLDWAKNMAGERNIAQTRFIIRQILEQSFRLDGLGLDRGDMGCISEDAIVCDRQVVLIDFSAASCHRRPANVTCLAQGLFWGTAIAPYLTSLLTLPDRESLIAILRRYKQHRNRENFDRFLAAIGLAD